MPNDKWFNPRVLYHIFLTCRKRAVRSYFRDQYWWDKQTHKVKRVKN